MKTENYTKTDRVLCIAVNENADIIDVVDVACFQQIEDLAAWFDNLKATRGANRFRFAIFNDRRNLTKKRRHYRMCDKGHLRFDKAVLVYQAGIANVFSVYCWNMAEFGRDAKRLLQSDFRTCEAFARGLAVAGVSVTSMACNQAGDIATAKWTDNLVDQPFSDKFNPVGVDDDWRDWNIL